MNEFAPGGYGDDSGVSFYGPPDRGYLSDHLAISDSYIEPIFRTIQARAVSVPRLVTQWELCEGWANASIPVAVSVKDAQDLVDALAALSISGLARHCEWGTPEEFIRCASAIGKCLQDHVKGGVPIYIQDD